jgi:transcription initiation factor TFIIIB Brf1 subunit/transcription initiation factor TFIIB
MRPSTFLADDVDERVHERAEHYFDQLQDADTLSMYTAETIGRTAAFYAGTEHELISNYRFEDFICTGEESWEAYGDVFEQVAEAYPNVHAELSPEAELPHPVDHVPAISDEVTLGSEAELFTYVFLAQAEQKGLLSAQKPQAVAAGAVYLADKLSGGELLRQSDVAEAAGVSRNVVGRHEDRIVDHILNGKPLDE